jgi:hypothetical protein
MDWRGSRLDWPKRCFFASLDFVGSEGIGLLIYGAISFLMDNTAVFLVPSTYCGYVKMPALYSAALVTCLPNCWLALKFQPKLWDEGTVKTRIGFVVGMVIVSVAFFLVRAFVVYSLGWAELLKRLVTPVPWKVPIAVLVPPIVDGLQSGLLILSSMKSDASREQRIHASNLGAASDVVESTHESNQPSCGIWPSLLQTGSTDSFSAPLKSDHTFLAAPTALASPP